MSAYESLRGSTSYSANELSACLSMHPAAKYVRIGPLYNTLYLEERSKGTDPIVARTIVASAILETLDTLYRRTQGKGKTLYTALPESTITAAVEAEKSTKRWNTSLGKSVVPKNTQAGIADMTSMTAATASDLNQFLSLKRK